MSDKNDDMRHLIEAENSLSHMEDQRRLIDSRDSEIHRLVAPLRERKLRNHFLDEYQQLFAEGNRFK